MSKDRRGKPAGAFIRRRAGLLLHPTSLPGPGGQGDLGPEAYRFVDFLQDCGCSVWQMLPLGPTHADRSPYQCLSVHAGSPRLISLDLLARWGWLEFPGDSEGDPQEARQVHLEAAYNGFRRRATGEQQAEYDAFVQRHDWLEDYALYQALRDEHQGRAWLDWPAPLRDRHLSALNEARRRLAGALEQIRFQQFVFYRQWHALRAYANERGVLLFGDMPIFVAHDSAEVWAHREFFALDETGSQQVVAGVPPDYFSETGQRWGNPHYRWDALQADHFGWWVQRMGSQLELFDLVRVDHFRGFQAYWEIPAEAETAVDGRWVEAPGEALFERLYHEFHQLPLVAEDLGYITPEVESLRRRFALPGMKVLQFAFDGGPGNPYLPHNHEALGVAYTGTHDNDTTVGWFDRIDEQARAHVRDYLGLDPQAGMPWPLIRAAMASVARLAVVPMQDIMGLGSADRMNVPGQTEDNWVWRFTWDQVPEDAAPRLAHLVRLYGRESAPPR
ncbi:MAG TPA: 4-alpha-glucanotransferase [Gammaproteobacteria bacterium]|nr:4-alpha-glucanotransferase [Gammaproteobacteria bacterium]